MKQLWLCIACVSLFIGNKSISAASLPELPTPPSLAVFPLLSENDEAYGVFFADRLVVELIQHRDLPATKSRWFELVEPDTISQSVITTTLSTQQTVSGNALAALNQATNADYAMVGTVTQEGIRQINLKLVDLETGKITWEGKARDDNQWMWTQSQNEVGEFALANIINQLGFLLGEKRRPAIRANELPTQIAIRPFYTSHRALVSMFEKMLQDNIAQNGLFETQPAKITSGIRLDKITRQVIHDQSHTDAILCGSLLGLGKDQAINHTALTLRLVSLPSGQILWAGSASSQRVWRKDDFDMLAQSICTDLTTQMAQARSGAIHEAFAFRTTPEDGPGWIQRGMIYLESGLLAESEEAFTNALSYPESEAAAQEGLGQVFARRPALRQRAVTAYRRAIDLNPNSAELHYRLAKVYFDMGMELTVSTAQRAIEIDPTLSRPYRLIADWYAQGDWYNNTRDDNTAVQYYVKYLKQEPDDMHAALSLGKVLLRTEQLKQIETVIIPILNTHPEATELLPIAGQWAAIMERYAESASYWDAYLSRTSPLELHHFESPQLLMSDAQKSEYTNLPETAKRGYINRFWQHLDLDVTSTVNERLLEHYKRVWFARQNFAEIAYPWDQRGEVFIRYGEPDYRSRSNRVPATMSAAVQQVKDRLYADIYDQPPEETQVGTVFPVRSSRAMQADQIGLMGARTQYEADVRINGDGTATIIYGDGTIETIGTPIDESGFATGLFALVPPDEIERALRNMAEQHIAEHNAQAGSIGAQSHVLGDAFMSVGSGADHSMVPWESWVYVSIGGGIEITFTDEMGAGNYDFAPIPMRLPPGMRSLTRLQEHAPEATFERTVQETPEQHRPWWETKPFDFYYASADFQGEEKNTLFEVAFGVPTDSTQNKSRQVELAFAVTDTLRGKIYRQSKNVEWGTDISPRSLLTDVLGTNIRPGGYQLDIKAQNASANQISLLRQIIDVEAYETVELQMSDIVLASQVYEDKTDTQFRKQALQVVPHPTHLFQQGQDLGTYFEVYNLQKDTFGQAHYRVKLQIQSLENRTGLQRIFKGQEIKPEIQLTYDQVGELQDAQIYQYVDLTEIKPGRNRLVVEVQDLQSGHITSKSVEFHYEQP